MKHFFWLSFVLRSECDYILIIVIMDVTEKWYDDQINNEIDYKTCNDGHANNKIDHQKRRIKRVII